MEVFGGRGKLIYELKIGLDACDTGLSCSNLAVIKTFPGSFSLIKIFSFISIFLRLYISTVVKHLILF